MRLLLLAATFLILYLGILPPCAAASDNNCHFYDKDDPNPKVSRMFGRYFQQDYEFGEICGSVVGPIKYFVGKNPVRYDRNICFYREREITWVGIKGDDKWKDAVPSFVRASFGDMNCPPLGDSRYLPTDEVEPEVLPILWKF